MRLVPALLVLSACGDTFRADGIDVDVDSLVASFVETASADFDADEDGEIDGTQRRIGIVLTDREDLCDLGTIVDEVDDILAVQIIALHVDGGDELRTNTSLFEALLAPSAGNEFVGIRVIERSGGQTTTQLASRNLLDAEFVGRGELFVSGRSVSNGTTTRLSASFEDVLGADLSDPERFDTDGNGDEELDYLSISEEVSGRVAGARNCDSLGILP